MMMTDKYSLAKCDHYGRRLAAHLCAQHFGPAPDAALDGPAVLRFTPVRQVNLFVVRQLLHQWQQEASRLRSAYFDFAAPAVQAALTQFQNTLSRHISLSRPVFEPLLAQATADALCLAINPTSAFERLLPSSTELTAEELREGLRYFDLNKEFLAAFLNSLPPTTALSRGQVLSRLRAYQESNYREHQPLQQLVSALSALLPLTEADLRQDGPTAATPASEPSHAPAPITVAPTPPAPDNTNSAPQKDISNASSQVASSSGAPLHEKLKANQPPTVPLAMALRAAQPQSPALIERAVTKVESLRDAISINQRFSFINELFSGENMEYHAAIQHLDSLNDLDQARRYITQNLAQRYDWTRKEEHVAKLLKLVDRKFAPST